MYSQTKYKYTDVLICHIKFTIKHPLGDIEERQCCINVLIHEDTSDNISLPKPALLLFRN